MLNLLKDLEFFLEAFHFFSEVELFDHYDLVGVNEPPIVHVHCVYVSQFADENGGLGTVRITLHKSEQLSVQQLIPLL